MGRAHPSQRIPLCIPGRCEAHIPQSTIHPILLVEDDPDDVEFVTRAFRRANVLNPLEVHSTVGDAQRYLTDGVEKPAAIITDVYLPRNTSGLDLIRWVRSNEPPLGDTAVIVMTVSVDRTHYQLASSMGAVGFLHKPVTDEVLLDTLRAAGVLVSRMVKGRKSGIILERRE